MDLHAPRPLRITCSRELGEALAAEVEALGLPVRGVQSTAVFSEGGLAEAMRLNLHLRLAFHVQLELASFRCRDPEELYRRVHGLPWEDVLDPDGYLSVVSRVSTPTVDNTMFPSLKVKDGVVDRMTDRLGRRPDSGPRKDRTVLSLQWHGQSAVLYLDTSGEKLSDRGYRRRVTEAPMRETLAAAVVSATGYDGSGPLVNPMCGSGTLAIEAALTAARIAPGLLRDNFGFMHVRAFDREAWEALRAEAQAARREPPAPIVASDQDPKAVDSARKNAAAAGVDRWIRFQTCDATETEVPELAEGAAGVVLLNPPYGKRLGQQDALKATYKRVGDFFKQRCQGYTGYVFTEHGGLAKSVGLRAKRRRTFHNGELECRLLTYELYAGSKKQKKQRPAGEAGPS
jgi:putative N6-adenine-specific DNA methylase